jgi:hypothetical protein
MRKVDGLRIDYKTGEADIQLDPAFLGQSPEFQAVACSYWIANLLDVRNKAMDKSGDGKRRLLRENLDFKTVEEILGMDHGILFLGDTQTKSGKRFLVSTNLFKEGAQNHSYFCWESFGYNTFICLARIECPQNTLKTIRRKSRSMFALWEQLQSMVIASSGGRIGGEMSYRHFLTDVAGYLYGEDAKVAG